MMTKLLFLSQSLADQPNTSPKTIEAKDASTEVINAMDSFIESSYVSGVVTLVSDGDRTLHVAAQGLADIESKRPMTLDTGFAIASMTKPVTGTAIMMLRDRGQLQLDDLVKKYIPEFEGVQLRNGKELNRDLTLRDCLTHTAGLAGSQVFKTSLANAAQEIASRKLAFQPGEKWQYSPGITIAGRIVEIVSKRPFETFLNEEIFQPLKMSDTTFYMSEVQREKLATLYDRTEEGALVAVDHKYNCETPSDGPNPSAGLVSTAEDMAKFYRCILNRGAYDGGRLLAEDSVLEMTKIQTGDLKAGFVPGSGWGLSWSIVAKPQGITRNLSEGTFGHGGAHGTQGWVDPIRKRIYVLMIQRQGLPNADGSEIRDAFQAAGAKIP